MNLLALIFFVILGESLSQKSLPFSNANLLRARRDITPITSSFSAEDANQSKDVERGNSKSEINNNKVGFIFSTVACLLVLFFLLFVIFTLKSWLLKNREKVPYRRHNTAPIIRFVRRRNKDRNENIYQFKTPWKDNQTKPTKENNTEMVLNPPTGQDSNHEETKIPGLGIWATDLRYYDEMEDRKANIKERITFENAGISPSSLSVNSKKGSQAWDLQHCMEAEEADYINMHVNVWDTENHINGNVKESSSRKSYIKTHKNLSIRYSACKKENTSSAGNCKFGHNNRSYPNIKGSNISSSKRAINNSTNSVAIKPCIRTLASLDRDCETSKAISNKCDKDTKMYVNAFVTDEEDISDDDDYVNIQCGQDKLFSQMNNSLIGNAENMWTNSSSDKRMNHYVRASTRKKHLNIEEKDYEEVWTTGASVHKHAHVFHTCSQESEDYVNCWTTQNDTSKTNDSTTCLTNLMTTLPTNSKVKEGIVSNSHMPAHFTSSQNSDDYINCLSADQDTRNPQDNKFSLKTMTATGSTNTKRENNTFITSYLTDDNNSQDSDDYVNSWTLEKCTNDSQHSENYLETLITTAPNKTKVIDDLAGNNHTPVDSSSSQDSDDYVNSWTLDRCTNDSQHSKSYLEKLITTAPNKTKVIDDLAGNSHTTVDSSSSQDSDDYVNSWTLERCTNDS
ncbi:probable serine/threonine-protein kinase clkA [Protopterus annectens]|uniref:probable serine/threonine-protein kinase clkA n=1 Tax=Protopterus annectens TaxID=7888 RepID=UPI001CFB9E15|nr:probable serine/threonine-protein kinase clkA [Protopterus annectens]